MRAINIYQAPYAWVMSTEHRHVQGVIEKMETFGRRGEEWDYERDDKGLMKFGFATETAASHFRAMLRRCETAAPDDKTEPRRTAH